MDLGNRRHEIIYVVVAGFAFYIIGAMLSAIFIVAVPMAKDWCLDSVTIEKSEGEYETICTEFKNDFEARKYYHNKRMVTRNKYLLAMQFLLALGTTGLLFYFIPKWKGLNPSAHGGHFLEIAIVAFVVSIVVPLILGWLLPAPVKWFPSVFKEMNDAQVNEALRNLR